MARRALVAVGLVGAVLAGTPPPAWATTGPTIALPHSRYAVGSQVEKLYVGAYELRSVARAAKIFASALGIEVNRGFLFGLAQFYGYDVEGNQTLWVSELYNFHQVAKGVMVIDLLAPGGQPIMGRLFVTRSRQGDLSGQIQLPLGRYPISWHKVSNNWTPTKG
jgi:hypothetical protein